MFEAFGTRVSYLFGVGGVEFFWLRGIWEILRLFLRVVFFSFSFFPFFFLVGVVQNRELKVRQSLLIF